MSKTGLDPQTLASVLRELLAKKMIFVTGELEPARVGDAYISMRPSARGYVDMMLYKST